MIIGVFMDPAPHTMLWNVVCLWTALLEKAVFLPASAVRGVRQLSHLEAQDSEHPHQSPGSGEDLPELWRLLMSTKTQADFSEVNSMSVASSETRVNRRHKSTPYVGGHASSHVSLQTSIWGRCAGFFSSCTWGGGAWSPSQDMGSLNPARMHSTCPTNVKGDID